ncbi:MAG: diacylglycerol kinase [Acidobacteria bacterium]|nr:MAG: diacylglycerol kinase [Acidobacteriota bacterium]
MKALFLVNERSGARRRFDVSDVIRRTTMCEYEIVPCGAKGELPAIIERAEREAFDVVYAVGGDGTVHETAKHLVGRMPALGILPIGSGNGFARHIGLPMDAARAIRACAAGTIVAIDTAEVNGNPFIGVMGVGFDALVAQRFASSTVRGLKTYLTVGTVTFVQYQADEYEITTPQTTLRKRAFTVAIANSGHYGNNARIAPLASLRDGLLDVVIVDDASLMRALLLLPPLFLGTLHRARGVTWLQTPEVTVRRSAEGEAHLDGEPYILPAELHIRVVPRSLRLLVPDHVGRI